MVVRQISTHTPLAGRDKYVLTFDAKSADFNSHAPRGARPNPSTIIWTYPIFQLTRPSRGATDKNLDFSGNCLISTHTPLAGRDNNGSEIAFSGTISTHTPLAGRDIFNLPEDTATTNFNSHAPRGARLDTLPRLSMPLYISTHTPLAGRDASAIP